MEENENSTCCETDIIIQLYGMGLDSVLKQIFMHLDLKSIMNVERVSKSWKEMIDCLSIWEAFVKTQIAIQPLWKRIYKLLKSDESLCPEEWSISFKEVPKAVYKTLDRLEEIFTDGISGFDRYAAFKEIKLDSASFDKTSARHLQIDDDYIALKDNRGTIKVWSRRTCLLQTELESIPEQANSFGTYAIGDNLVLYSDLNGIIHVWDLVTNRVIFSIKELQGVQIKSLHFNPSAGVLMSSNDINSGKLGSLLTLWKGRKELWGSTIQRGHFFLKYQYPLPDVNVLRILGWDVCTFGILCTKPRETTLELVQIYTYKKTFKLLAEIRLDDEYEYDLDWSDGYLAIMFRSLIKIYDVETGVCLQSVQNDPPRYDPIPKCVSICSSMLATTYTHLYGDECVFRSCFDMNPSKGFLELNQKSYVFSETVHWSLKSVEKVRFNELQMVTFAINLSDESPALEVVDFYPACKHCGLYKRGMAKFDSQPEFSFCNHLPKNPFCSVHCCYSYCKPRLCDRCHLWIQDDETGRGVEAPLF